MFGSKNKSSKPRDAVIASLPVDEDGNVPEDFLRRRNNLRSRRSRAADGRSTARKVYPKSMPPEQAVSWVMHPGRSDVEGIDCQGKANVPRRDTKKGTGKQPAKAKPKKPEGPEPKVPEPKAPEPVVPSVVLSGREIVDTIRLITSVIGDHPVFMGHDMYITWDDTHYISLSRRDGKGLFGLDADATEDKEILTPMPITKLSVKEVYKVTLEERRLVFRTGDDFSKEALEVRVGFAGHPRHLPSLYRQTRFHSTDSFVPDIPTFRTAVRQMYDTGSDCCYLVGTGKGTFITTRKEKKSRCEIEAIIGGPVDGDGAGRYPTRAGYWTKSLYLLLKGPGDYLDSARFGEERALILEGTFCDYHLMVAVLNLRLR